MQTTEKLEKALSVVMAQFDEVNAFFIAKIAAQIQKIGQMSQSSINQLTIMMEMSQDVTAIKKKLQTATGLASAQMAKVYQAAMDDVYTDPRFAAALESQPLSDAAQNQLRHYVRAVSMQTAGDLQNYSNTTAVSDAYKKAMDKAVLAASSGLTDYNSAMRRTVQELGYNGLQVQYASGYHRRLDTAVRQNIIDATNQIAKNGAQIIGDDLGFNAREISAHAHSAPDHEPVQGRVFLIAEFEKMQSGQPFVDVEGHVYTAFHRPISEWNCTHFPVPFDTRYSVRRYTDEQLAAWKAANDAGVEIGGKHYTIYQATQLMRRIETESRHWKDAANACRLTGDMAGRRECQKHINALGQTYSEIVQKSGLPSQRQRMAVEGFKAVKVK
jgi:hypothetical protein